MQVKSESEAAQSFLTLFDLMDCSLPGSSTHGIFQARVLKWVAIAFSWSFYKQMIYVAFAHISLAEAGHIQLQMASRDIPLTTCLKCLGWPLLPKIAPLKVFYQCKRQ